MSTLSQVRSSSSSLLLEALLFSKGDSSRSLVVSCSFVSDDCGVKDGFAMEVDWGRNDLGVGVSARVEVMVLQESKNVRMELL